MKHITIAVAFAALSFLSSCKNDDAALRSSETTSNGEKVDFALGTCENPESIYQNAMTQLFPASASLTATVCFDKVVQKCFSIRDYIPYNLDCFCCRQYSYYTQRCLTEKGVPSNMVKIGCMNCTNLDYKNGQIGHAIVSAYDAKNKKCYMGEPQSSGNPLRAQVTEVLSPSGCPSQALIEYATTAYCSGAWAGDATRKAGCLPNMPYGQITLDDGTYGKCNACDKECMVNNGIITEDPASLVGGTCKVDDKLCKAGDPNCVCVISNSTKCGSVCDGKTRKAYSCQDHFSSAGGTWFCQSNVCAHN